MQCKILRTRDLKTNKNRNILTFDTRHLFATSLAEQRELTGDRVKHLDKVGQKQNYFHFVVGQVTTTADALCSLNVGAAQ